MKSASLIAIAIGLSALLSHGQNVPAAINYQGRVTDSTGTGLGTGTPVNRKMIFRLFSTTTGGNPIWSEQQTVTLANGEFSVLLGTGIDASFGDTARPSLLSAFGGSDRYLEIVVDNGDGTLNATDVPIAPRQRLTSTAYAIRAATADSVPSGADLNLRDSNNGLGWYGTDRLFNGQNINGPVLYGFGGGALGSSQNGTLNTALRWDGAGNVGIGTAASSGTKLTLSGALGLFDGATRSTNAGISTELGGALIQMGVNDGPSNRFGGNYNSASQGGLIRLDSRNSSNLFSIFGRPAASTADASTLMVVNSAGNVGIGTTNPSQKLDVFGSIRVNNGALGLPDNSASGGAGSRLILWPGSTTETPYGFGMNGFTLWSSVPTSASFRWFGGTTERMSLNGNTGALSVTGDLAAKSLTTGSYDTASDSFINVRTKGDFLYKSGINLKHHDENWGFSLFSDNRTTNGYGFHLTSSNNSTPVERLFIHANTGDVGIGNIAPSAKLDVSGKIKSDGKPVPVGEEDLRFVRGSIAALSGLTLANTFFDSPRIGTANPPNPLILRGAGYQFRVDDASTYTIKFVTAFSDVPSISVTPVVIGGSDRKFVKIISASASEFQIQFRNSDGVASGHSDFHFIVAGPR